jgi:hypothetical protein
MDSSAIEFLNAAQNPDGGWGYAPGQSSAVEPTSAAVLAIRESPTLAESYRKAVSWLHGGQRADGGWGIRRDDIESGWQTAWAITALSSTNKMDDILKNGGKWLLGVKALQFTGDEMKNIRKDILAINFSLRGWPWLPGQASFIEPTALSIIALQSIPDKIASTDRMDEALRYIQDRRCPGGGWNVGSPMMFNVALPARVHPTAWVLLALFRFAPKAVLPEDVRALRSDMLRDGGALGLAWGLLALRTLGEDDSLAETRLARLRIQGGGWSKNPYVTAVALMAIRGHI